MTNRSGDEQQLETTHRTQHWYEVLQRAGYRLTPARRAIVTTIADFDGPFDAPQILGCAQAKQPQLGLATVYRTLETLAALGLIQRLHDNQGCHNYLALGKKIPPLLRCSNCGRLEYVEGVALQTLIEAVAAHANYQIEHYSLQLSGLCEECQS